MLPRREITAVVLYLLDVTGWLVLTRQRVHVWRLWTARMKRSLSVHYSSNTDLYYQFYANILIALLWAYPVHRLLRTSSLLGVGTDLGVIVIAAVLFAGSRDAFPTVPP